MLRISKALATHSPLCPHRAGSAAAHLALSSKGDATRPACTFYSLPTLVCSGSGQACQVYAAQDTTQRVEYRPQLFFLLTNIFSSLLHHTIGIFGKEFFALRSSSQVLFLTVDTKALVGIFVFLLQKMILHFIQKSKEVKRLIWCSTHCTSWDEGVKSLVPNCSVEASQAPQQCCRCISFSVSPLLFL